MNCSRLSLKNYDYFLSFESKYIQIVITKSKMSQVTINHLIGRETYNVSLRKRVLFGICWLLHLNVRKTILHSIVNVHFEEHFDGRAHANVDFTGLHD
jgi:hypothetical protein